MTLQLYTPNNNPVVDFDQFNQQFRCSLGTTWDLSELHKAAVTDVYVAGVAYEDRGAVGRNRAVMEIQGNDIGKVTPDFYTVYTISNTDTPTLAMYDHKRLDKAVLQGALIARLHGLPLQFRT